MVHDHIYNSAVSSNLSFVNARGKRDQRDQREHDEETEGMLAVNWQRRRNKAGAGTESRRRILCGRIKLERLSVKCVLFGQRPRFTLRGTARPQRAATLSTADR